MRDKSNYLKEYRAAVFQDNETWSLKKLDFIDSVSYNCGHICIF